MWIWIGWHSLGHQHDAGITFDDPFRIGWAYLTGAGHIAAGTGVLFSIFPRAAALAEAGMLSVFTILVWIPAIAAAPRTRLPWTAFFISWAITSAAWLVATNMRTKKLPSFQLERSAVQPTLAAHPRDPQDSAAAP